MEQLYLEKKFVHRSGDYVEQLLSVRLEGLSSLLSRPALTDYKFFKVYGDHLSRVPDDFQSAVDILVLYQTHVWTQDLQARLASKVRKLRNERLHLW